VQSVRRTRPDEANDTFVVSMVTHNLFIVRGHQSDETVQKAQTGLESLRPSHDVRRQQRQRINALKLECARNDHRFYRHSVNMYDEIVDSKSAYECEMVIQMI
jgi:hypothetical protein